MNAAAPFLGGKTFDHIFIFCKHLISLNNINIQHLFELINKSHRKIKSLTLKTRTACRQSQSSSSKPEIPGPDVPSVIIAARPGHCHQNWIRSTNRLAELERQISPELPAQQHLFQAKAPAVSHSAPWRESSVTDGFVQHEEKTFSNMTGNSRRAVSLAAAITRAGGGFKSHQPAV